MLIWPILVTAISLALAPGADIAASPPPSPPPAAAPTTNTAAAPAKSPPVPVTLDDRVASVLPTAEEERFLTVGWRTNLMAARAESQTSGRPIFLWIVVGNPQGCT
jgi:hypothetical protein